MLHSHSKWLWYAKHDRGITDTIKLYLLPITPLISLKQNSSTQQSLDNNDTIK